MVKFIIGFSINAKISALFYFYSTDKEESFCFSWLDDIKFGPPKVSDPRGANSYQWKFVYLSAGWLVCLLVWQYVHHCWIILCWSQFNNYGLQLYTYGACEGFFSWFSILLGNSVFDSFFFLLPFTCYLLLVCWNWKDKDRDIFKNQFLFHRSKTISW